MRAPRQSGASRLATATAVSEEARLARRAETASRVLGAALRPPVPLAIVAVVLAVPFVALSLAIVPHGPDTPATMELADNVVTRPLPNAVVHGPIRFRDGGYWLAP